MRKHSSQPDPEDDKHLVRLSQAGDRAAVEKLLAAHYDRIYSICRQLVGNDADAADGCQEALISISKGLKSFDGRSTFKTWSYRVASNACLDEMRRRSRRPVPIEEIVERATPGADTFDQQFADQSELRAAFEQLRPEYKEPLILRDLVGLSYSEIAENLKIPPGTVRSRISRGRGQMLKLLSENSSFDRNQPTGSDRQTHTS